jgi:CDP-diacylglycerol--glycerol-3-phosphate 3-phosphatidyltransferase
MNLPNALTLSRMAVAPIFVVCLLSDGFGARFAALLLFTGASITDWFDGYLARSRGAITDVGKLIDPLADKLLTSLAFIGLVALGRIHAVPVLVIIGRDLLVTSLRAMAGDKGVVMAASNLAKWKTAIQMLAIGGALIHLAWEAWCVRQGVGVPVAGFWVWWAAMIRTMVFTTAAMALISGARYLRAVWTAVRS